MPGENLEEFNVATDDEGSDSESFKYAYWKRKDGWVVVAANWPVEYRRQVRKGMTPLEQYGEFLLYEAQEKWRVNKEPYRRILLMGGAHEFPVEQIIAHHWHRKPPYRGVKFPQLEGVTVHEAKCSICGKPFASVDEQRAGYDRARHEGIAHKEASQQQGYARALAEALGKLDNQNSGPLAEVVKALAEAQQQQGQMIARLMETLDGPREKKKAG